MGELFKGQTYSETSKGVRRYWKIEDLWRLAKGRPIEHLPVEMLVDQLEGTCWTEGDEDVTPQWVLGHTRRILGAEMEYPILLNEDNIIVDGIHRLCKAVLEGKETISVQRLQQLPEPTFATAEDEFPLFI